MKIAPNLNFTVVKPEQASLNSFVQMIKTIYQNFVQAFNGNIGFGDGTNLDNVNGSWINTVAPVGPNTDFTVNHNLGRLPSGYWVMQKDRACDVYTGSVAATKTQITLRATVASAVIRLFIIGLILCLLPINILAQGARHDNIALVAVTLPGSLGVGGKIPQIVQGATVTVCLGSVAPLPGVTCTGLANIFSDVALSQSLPNPTNADANGNYFFFASENTNYVISVGGLGVTTYSYVWTAPIVSGNSHSFVSLIVTTINTSHITSGTLGIDANNLSIGGNGGGVPDFPVGMTFETGFGNSGLSPNSHLLISPNAPSIAGAGCGGSAASIPNNNGTAAFEINVGTAPTSACTITLPAALHNWYCSATDLTTNSASIFLQKQTLGGGTTSAIITNFNTSAVTTAFVANDVLRVSCHAY